MSSSFKVKGDGVRAALEQLKAAQGKELRVGWFEGNKYSEEDGKTVAQVAHDNEFGVGVPARPFMRPAIAENANDWAKKIDAMNKAGIHVENIFEILGGTAQGDIQKAITNVTEPPLSPYTIEKRREKTASGKRTGSLEKPLVDSGQMISTVTYEVKK